MPALKRTENLSPSSFRLSTSISSSSFLLSYSASSSCVASEDLPFRFNFAAHKSVEKKNCFTIVSRTD